MQKPTAARIADRRHLPTMSTSPLALAAHRLQDDSGSVASIVGLAIVPLILALGLAVDGGMAYSAHSKLQGAVDAAALASARASSSDEGDIEGDARMFFDANFPSTYFGSRVTDFDARFNETTGELTVDAGIDLPTSFMRVAGLPTVSVAASAVAQRQLNGIELSMVLDITGSMNDPDPSGGTKIQALKDASETLLTTIYGEKETLPDVSISVVPYNTQVNLGDDRESFLTGFDEADFGGAGWKGCVEARAEPYDQDDTPPSEQPFTAYLWPAVVDDPETPANEPYFNPTNDPNAYCPDSEVLPLTAERSVISDHIEDLEARGATLTNVGFIWGWRTISPEWRTAWDIQRVETDDDNELPEISTGRSATQAPVDYDDPLISKAIIFMTDGEADVLGQDDPLLYTAYGFLQDERLGTGNEALAEAEANDRLLASCELAKAEGIQVYTVMFDLDDATIERDYRACASSEDHFFDAPDGEALETAFKDIAGQLTTLRLTQ